MGMPSTVTSSLWINALDGGTDEDEPDEIGRLRRGGRAEDGWDGVCDEAADAEDDKGLRAEYDIVAGGNVAVAP